MFQTKNTNGRALRISMNPQALPGRKMYEMLVLGPLGRVPSLKLTPNGAKDKAPQERENRQLKSLPTATPWIFRGAIFVGQTKKRPKTRPEPPLE